jgi:UDP-N-acetylmuramate--alanine ligase
MPVPGDVSGLADARDPADDRDLADPGDPAVPVAARPDLSVPMAVHIVGAGGAGMSAIATTLSAMGHTVTGSDLKDSRALDRLRVLGVDVAVGHAAGNVAGGVALVAVSTAIPMTNPEVVEALDRQIPVLRRAEVLAGIAAQRDTVAVAGTHGKTTTSSMLVLILIEAGLAPSFIVGGDLNEIGSGAAWDDGRWLVVEADESDGTFLELPRHAAIVTNVEPDHLEHHGSWENLQGAFASFVTQTPGPVVLCADDAQAAVLARVATGGDGTGAPDAGEQVVTYGVAADATYRMVDLRSGRGGCEFTLVRGGDVLGVVTLPVAGEHNALNAAGALVCAMQLGAPFAAGVAALARFAGVARRFEHRGSAAGVHLVDDYAHLPTEVAAAVAAARDGGWARVVCVFQPHRYSRTEAMWQDFADAFTGADLVVVTDVYASGERPRPGVSGQLVVDAVMAAHGDAVVSYIPGLNDVVAWLGDELRPGDLCLTLGAGDLTTVPTRVLADLQRRTTSGDPLAGGPDARESPDG